MDFSAWSPSHTILLIFMVLSTIVTAIAQVWVLFYRVNKVEQRLDTTDDRIDKMKSEMSDRISEVKDEITNDRNQNQATWMSLNQHLINHLRDHSNPQQQSQPPPSSGGRVPDLETVRELVTQEIEKLRGDIHNGE